MHMAVAVVFDGQLEDREYLVGRRAGAVGQPETDADGSGVESGGDVLLQGFLLLGGKRLRESFPFQPRIRPGHDDVAGVGVADRRSVVEHRLTFAFGIETGDILDAEFEFEGAGNPVTDLGAVVFRAVPVPMQVNEPRGNNMPGGLEHLGARDLVFAQDGDLAVVDPDVAHRVQTGLGVHHAAVRDDDVIGRRRRAGKEKKRQGKGQSGAQHGDQYGTRPGRVQLPLPVQWKTTALLPLNR